MKYRLPMWAVCVCLVTTALVAAGAQVPGTGLSPAHEALFRKARENMVRSDRIDHLYTVKERRTDIHTNPFGRMGTGGTRVFEIYPSSIRQLTYRREVEINGHRVPAAELEQQDRAYRARVAEAQQRGVGTPSDQQAREEGSRQRSQNRIADIIDTLSFKVEGHTTYEGVPATIVSFTPRPNANPTTREGRIAQKFTGKIWIHDGATEVMRVEGTAIDDISYGMGMVAKLNKGATATLTRRPVDGNVWMPTELKLNGRGRAALMLRRLVVDFAMEWFDYRRLDNPSLTPFLDPRVQSQTGGRPQ